MPSLTCRRCHRVLSNPKSVINGMGPVCWAREQAAQRRATLGDGADSYDLPFDRDAGDIICRRDGRALRFNLTPRLSVHSPSGWEWGYGGSGPADFALNILVYFIKADPNHKSVKVAGRRIPASAWEWHQAFKADFVARLPETGGTISGAEIRRWLWRRGITEVR